MTALDVIEGRARWSVERGDALERLKTLPAAGVDSIVADPPAGIGFMSKGWDRDKGGRDKWIAWLAAILAEGLRCLKPGGWALVWALPRTSHWTAMAVEDAGFEVRDKIPHLFGSGFPKSLDVVKAIIDAEGPLPSPDPEAYERIGWAYEHRDGYGTALKPATEDWILARKPLDGTVAATILKHGTGALNINGCRVQGGKGVPVSPRVSDSDHTVTMPNDDTDTPGWDPDVGRWPANVVVSHTEWCRCVGTKRVRTGTTYEPTEGERDDYRAVTVSPSGYLGRTVGYADEDGLEEVEAWECVDGCAVAALDAQSGTLVSGSNNTKQASGRGYVPGALGAESRPAGTPMISYGDLGGASRFFYCAKPSTSEREAGCAEAGLPLRTGAEMTDSKEGQARLDSPRTGAGRSSRGRRNYHPTAKSIALMRYFCRLVTPPGGIVLDMFMGSGTTGCGAVLEQLRFVGIDLDLDDDGQPAGYVDIARARIAYWDKDPVARQQKLFDL